MVLYPVALVSKKDDLSAEKRAPTQRDAARRKMADEKVMLGKLEAAELRIGMADESKLSALLDPALPNLLGFLSSPHASVRSKVMAILSHVNKRVKGDVNIKLPVRALAKVFATSTAPLAANLALVYIEMGLPRMSMEQRAELIGPLLVGVAARPMAQQETLFGILTSTLPNLPLPKTKADLAGQRRRPNEPRGMRARGGARPARPHDLLSASISAERQAPPHQCPLSAHLVPTFSSALPPPQAPPVLSPSSRRLRIARLCSSGRVTCCSSSRHSHRRQTWSRRGCRKRRRSACAADWTRRSCGASCWRARSSLSRGCWPPRPTTARQSSIRQRRCRTG